MFGLARDVSGFYFDGIAPAEEPYRVSAPPRHDFALSGIFSQANANDILVGYEFGCYANPLVSRTPAAQPSHQTTSQSASL